MDGGYLVKNPYSTEMSVERNGLLLSGAWSDSFPELMRRERVTALYLNSAYGWPGGDVGFLRSVPWIEELNLIASEASGLGVISQLSELEDLSLNTVIKDRIDFAVMDNLERCFVNSWRYVQDLSKAKNIRKLHLYGHRGKTLDFLRFLGNLECLIIAKSSVEDFSFLQEFHKLVRLEILDSRRVESFDPISQLHGLKWLRIEGVKELGFVSGLRSLEVLTLMDVGAITTIRPCCGLPNLKALSFNGRTVVADGDLSCLELLPKLALANFPDKSHYSHIPARKWDWRLLNVPGPAVTRRLG